VHDAAFVRMDKAGVEGGGGEGGGFTAEGDEAETAATDKSEGDQRPAALSLPHDVSHYRGQNLVQGLAASNAAAVLTGIPLISFAGSTGGLANAKFHQQQHQQQHHQQAYLMAAAAASYYTAAAAAAAAAVRQQQHHAAAAAAIEQPFVPRVIRPRRRKGKPNATTASSVVSKAVQKPEDDEEEDESEASSDWQVEDDDDNVKHFLPTDLLLETTMSLSSSSSPTARGKKATVRHAESVNPLAFSTDEGEQHMALRKTLSWAAAAAAEQKSNTFSLFPKTSDSDPLSSLRNDWTGKGPIEAVGEEHMTGGTKKACTNLEEALKNLSIDSSASITTRKF